MASDPAQRMTDDEIAGALATFMVRAPLPFLQSRLTLFRQFAGTDTGS